MSNARRDFLHVLPVENAYPENIVVIGGGRWARVLIKVICSIVNKSVKIFIYSRSNSSFMMDWIASENIDRDIRAISSLPDKLPASNAVIVVNAARDHAEAASLALLAGGNVMVEKPITLSYDASMALVKLSKKLGQDLVAAHIFLFSRYFERFSKMVAAAGKVTAISVHWMDPMLEQRYEELKQYDSGLPVFADWLPHILPMIGTLIQGKSLGCTTLDLKRGGASVDLHLMIDEIPCRIIVERDGEKRKRFMEVICHEDTLHLDFSSEPGTIIVGEEKFNGDPDWEKGEKPSVLMLKAFFQGVTVGNYDKRLDIEPGVNSTKIIDECGGIYRVKQIEWLVDQIAAAEFNDQDWNYALREIFQADGFLNNQEIINRIDKFKHVLASESKEYWIQELRSNKNQRTIIQMGSM